MGTVDHVWWWQERSGPVDLGFTDRLGGGSTGRYAGLNLADHVEDDPAAVAANRALLRGELGDVVLAPMRQVHGREVAFVTGTETAPPTADALVTDRTGVALLTMVADCTPVLFHDEAAGLVGAAHAGRPGLAAGVVPATVTALRDLGARDLRAVVGPSVCGRCYEVPEPMRAEVAHVAPAAYAMTWTGTPALDVAAGVVEQLAELGVPTRWVAGCSREAQDLYSYRRDGVTGRYAGVVVRR